MGKNSDELIKMAKEKTASTLQTIHAFMPNLSSDDLESIGLCLEAAYVNGYADGVAYCNKSIESLKGSKE